MRLTTRAMGGEGPPLVLLHGLFGSSANLAGLARRLKDDFHCVGLDLRNHGASPHAPAMDYATLARDVLETADHLGLGELRLLGHSLGGKVAMAAAAEAPGRVRALAVLDIAPAAYPRLMSEPVLGILRALDLAGISSRAEADARLAERLPDPRLRQFLLQNLVRDAGGLRWRIDLAALEAASPELADFPLARLPDAETPVYRGPVLLLRGGESSYAPDAHLGQLTRLYPRATVETLAGAGHWLHAEQPDAVASRVRAFLRQA
jgi:esterase